MDRLYQADIEAASKDTMEALQLERLQKTAKNVYENVPFYREAFDKAGVKPADIKTLSDLAKLPFTTKQDLRNTYPYGLLAVPMDHITEIHASSGTTGKQVVIGYTEHDLGVWGDVAARAIVAAGGSKSDKVHVSYGYGLFTGGFGLHYGARKLGATAIPVSTGNTKRQIQIMEDFGSSIVCCTPSYALYIAETMDEMGIDKSKLALRAGIFGAEPWTENMRHQIEKQLNIRAFDIYGLTEIIGPGVAFECSEQTGMHINEDHFLAEIIDPDTGEVLPEGTLGELCFTTITKEGFPLIRYRTRDICKLERKQCSCGRTLIKMTKPQGRTDDMLIIRGVNVFPSQIETVLLQHGQIAPYYQLIVDRVGNLDNLEVQVEMSGDWFSDTIKDIEAKEKMLKNAIDGALGIVATVKLVEPHSIARTEGKAKRVIDKRNLQ